MKRFIIPIRIFLGIGGIKPYQMNIKILFKNDDFIVINKEAGVLTHPTKFNEPDTLLNAVLSQLGMEGNVHKNMPGPISRLDRDTSGIVVFALSPMAKTELGNLMMARGFKKTYLALVKGRVDKEGEINTKILRISGTSKMGIHEEGKSAHTIFTRLQYFKHEDVSLVSIHLITGRTHQIRLHFSSIGHPLIGDWLYGDTTLNEHFSLKFGLYRQFLHAAELSFEHLILGKHEFKAELPRDLEETLKQLD